MDDLVRWLTARLDEDERIAREAEAAKEDGWWWRPDAESAAERHVAAHDPARVLREIDAKRQLLPEVFAYEAKIDGEWGCCHDADEIAAGECPERQPKDITALRLLALPYTDRDGYRDSWRP